MSNAIEIEAKVLVNADDYRKLVKLFPDAPRYMQTNYYIDSKDRMLAKSGIALRIRKPADTEWAVYPEVDFYDDWYGEESVRFEIVTTGYGDHSLRQAQRVTTGLLAATNLVQNLYAIAEVAGLAVRQ